MLDLQELQIIAQLVDNMEIMTGNLEDAYAKKNSQKFQESRNEILKSEKKIEQMIK